MIDPPRHAPPQTRCPPCCLCIIFLLGGVVLFGMPADFMTMAEQATGQNFCGPLPWTIDAIRVTASSYEGIQSGVWNLEWTDKALRPHCPSLGQAMVLVRSSSVNPVDWVEGTYQSSLDPQIGLDIAGTVVAVGMGCDLSVGDQVYGDTTTASGGTSFKNSYQQLALVYCDRVGRRPPDSPVSLADHGAIACGAGTAYEALQQLGAPWTAEQNMTVVVVAGAGGVGHFAVQIARALGAARVIAAASADHHAMLYGLGASLVVDYHAASLWDSLPARSVDAVFDNFGEPGTWKHALRALKDDGTYVEMMTYHAYYRSLWYDDTPRSTTGSEGDEGDISFLVYYGWLSSRRTIDRVSELVSAGKLRPVIQRRYPLADVALAFSESAGGHVGGKLLVDVPYPAGVECGGPFPGGASEPLVGAVAC